MRITHESEPFLYTDGRSILDSEDTRSVEGQTSPPVGGAIIVELTTDPPGSDQTVTKARYTSGPVALELTRKSGFFCSNTVVI